MRNTGLNGLPHAAEVDVVNHLLPQRFIDLVQLIAQGADARIGDDDVESAELLDAAIDSALQGVEVAGINLGRDDAPVEVLDHLGGLGQVLGCRAWRRRVVEPPADFDRNDVRALLRQADRMTAALAARRGGDERDFAHDAIRQCIPPCLGDRPITRLTPCLAAHPSVGQGLVLAIRRPGGR
jgi:hypothetical protein